MPLTKLQLKISRLLAKNRSKDSFLAGGAALHFHPKSTRFSNDLDFFHDSVERVATAFEADNKTLLENGFTIRIEIKQPGYIRALVSIGTEETKIEWAHDSAWRFFPAIYQEDLGLTLHPLDIAINKVLALAGRDEPRDFLDVVEIQRDFLPLGALCWAAVGKDPGFSPQSLLELLRRRGKYQPNEINRLILKNPIDLQELKRVWLTALENAERFFERGGIETGCLFYDTSLKRFIEPQTLDAPTIRKHFGTPGGIIPNFYTTDPLIERIHGRF